MRAAPGVRQKRGEFQNVSFMGSCNDTNINVTYFSAPDCAGSVSSMVTYDDGECVPDTGSDTGSRRYIKFECVGHASVPSGRPHRRHGWGGACARAGDASRSEPERWRHDKD